MGAECLRHPSLENKQVPNLACINPRARGYQQLLGRQKSHCPWVTFDHLPLQSKQQRQHHKQNGVFTRVKIRKMFSDLLLSLKRMLSTE